jgi:hypothetical protein
MKKKERKVIKTYEKDIKTISESLLSFANNSFNLGIQKRLQSLLGVTQIDPMDPKNLNRLNIVLYKNSILK